jgi:hypothetical protein
VRSVQRASWSVAWAFSNGRAPHGRKSIKRLCTTFLLSSPLLSVPLSRMFPSAPLPNWCATIILFLMVLHTSVDIASVHDIKLSLGLINSAPRNKSVLGLAV